MRFVRDFMLDNGISIRRKLRGSLQDTPPAVKRGNLMRTVRNSLAESRGMLETSKRMLQASDPLFQFAINDYVVLTFDFNFGEGTKELLLGVIFNFDSGDTLSNGYV
jgi:hypothetical protein